MADLRSGIVKEACLTVTMVRNGRWYRCAARDGPQMRAFPRGPQLGRRMGARFAVVFDGLMITLFKQVAVNIKVGRVCLCARE